MKEIQTHLGDESVTSDYEKLIELTNKLEELQAQQESLYEIWEELSE